MSQELVNFWTNAAPDYDRVVELQVGPGKRAKVRELVSQERALGHAVEFGCGSGFFTETLACNATSVLATDLSPGMLAHVQTQLQATNVAYQIQDCQRSTLEDATFDTVFLSLVLQFTDHEKTIAEIRRVLKRGGRLLIANLDVYALAVPERLRCMFRVIYHGRTGYRVRPPRGFGRNVIGHTELCALLERSGFKILGSETVANTSRASYIPVNYLRAQKT